LAIAPLICTIKWQFAPLSLTSCHQLQQGKGQTLDNDNSRPGAHNHTTYRVTGLDVVLFSLSFLFQFLFLSWTITLIMPTDELQFDEKKTLENFKAKHKKLTNLQSSINGRREWRKKHDNDGWKKNCNQSMHIAGMNNNKKNLGEYLFSYI
jgi:hypothetical protein